MRRGNYGLNSADLHWTYKTRSKVLRACAVLIFTQPGRKTPESKGGGNIDVSRKMWLSLHSASINWQLLNCNVMVSRNSNIITQFGQQIRKVRVKNSFTPLRKVWLSVDRILLIYAFSLNFFLYRISIPNFMASEKKNPFWSLLLGHRQPDGWTWSAYWYWYWYIC